MANKIEDPEPGLDSLATGSIESSGERHEFQDSDEQDSSQPALDQSFAPSTTDDINAGSPAGSAEDDDSTGWREENTNTKPKLLIEDADPDRTVEALREIVARTGQVYDRGVPVRIVEDRRTGGALAVALTTESVVMLAHQHSRPCAMRARDGKPPRLAKCRLPRYVAALYLDLRCDWNLPPLAGITSTPLLRADGTIHCAPGYDPVTGCWLENVPDVARLIPPHPTRGDAERALTTIRETFATFCFADALTTSVPDIAVPVVDTKYSPRDDESTFLAALLTAACRPSLDLAPGVMFRAAAITGAGSGKGLLARCLSLIAYGREPAAVTAGGCGQELEKRIAAELMGAGPVLLLDNINERALKSELLASALTETFARVRLLGKSEMVPINATALVLVTGNGVTVEEDLARRFIVVELDANVEDAEARAFTGDIRDQIRRRRKELLAAALTIWRWGRQTRDLARGQALGSFEQWCRWVRDPLLALGCADPVNRIRASKRRDPRRQEIGELFPVWLKHHGREPVTAAHLHENVLKLLDPLERGRQFVASRLQALSGTRMNGLVLQSQPPAGKWGATAYALVEEPFK